MKLRLTAPGWKTYTGQMGVIFFEEGLSVSDVLPTDAVRVAGVIGAEWEDGTAANISQTYLDNMKTEAPMGAVTTAVPEDEVEAPQAVAEAPVKSYTAEELAAVADKSGISGLREIAEPMGIKGNSIGKLIEAILKAGAPKAE